MPLATLGRLLHASYGVKGERFIGEWTYERSAPSAGGKYPLEIYVATQWVDGLEDGIHHYDARAHELELRRPGVAQPILSDLALDQTMVRDANLMAPATRPPDRTALPEDERALR